jgi:hypothetical protein
MTKIMTAALLLTAGFAAAQPANSPSGSAPAPAPAASPSAPSPEVKELNQEIRADRKEIHDDKRAIRQDNSAQRAQIVDLNAQEKAAMDEVTKDTTLSKPASDAAKRKIHADFKTKKDAIRAQMKVDRKAKRADISTERGDIQNDRQQRRQINHGDK